MKFIEGFTGALTVLFGFIVSILGFKLFMFIAKSIATVPLIFIMILLGSVIAILIKIQT